MYEHQGLKDIIFIMLYGGATFFAIMVCFYMLLTRGNMFSYAITPPKSLRRWAAAFMAMVAASHVWWVVLGIHVLADDRLTRNIVAITLDRLTIVPLMMAVLLRMLQDRHRPVWPVFVAMIPIAVLSVYSIITRSNDFELFTEYYSIFIGIVFIIYYVYAVRQYGRWLHDNFVDLEHKEVWQSLALLSFILIVYLCYTSNEGSLFTEYLAQINTLIIIAFVLWRVETLQQLDTEETIEEEEQKPVVNTINIPTYIDKLLDQHCKDKKLFLQHDLTLQQLAVAIGTNRTYLGAYFAQQGYTYNTYINTLRVEYFKQLYLNNKNAKQKYSYSVLAEQSGFRSYTTFSQFFKKINGYNVTEWMKSTEDNASVT